MIGDHFAYSTPDLSQTCTLPLRFLFMASSMKKVILALALVLILITRDDPVLRQVKQKYRQFIRSLPPQYSKIKRPVIITGTYARGDVGSNVNKGGEIYICLENSVNDAFHVLLHELAHTTVREYDHSSSFWESFQNLKSLAEQGGFYTSVGTKKYCGKEISDS